MFINYSTFLFLIITPLLTIKTWDDFKNYTEEQFEAEASASGLSTKEEYPPYKCSLVRDFIVSLKEFDKYYTAFQKKQKSESAEFSVTKHFTSFWQYMKSRDEDFENYEVLVQKKNAFEHILIKLGAINQEDIIENPEFEKVPTKKEEMYININHDLKHMDDSNIKTYHEHILQKSNFYIFGKELNKLMFVQNKEDDYKNFVCYSVPEISTLIFEIIYLRYITDKEGLKLFLKGFLENFFDTDNKIDKAIYYKLFKSFYAYHLQIILDLDEDIIFKSFQQFRKLQNKETRDFINDDFINLYDLLKDSIYAYHVNVAEKKKVSEIFSHEIKLLMVESSMFALIYGLGLAKQPLFTQMGFTGAYFVKLKIREVERKIVGSIKKYFHHVRNKYVTTIKTEIENIEKNEKKIKKKQKTIKEIYDDFHDNLNTFNNSAFFQSNFKLNDYFYEYTDQDLILIEKQEKKESETDKKRKRGQSQDESESMEDQDGFESMEDQDGFESMEDQDEKEKRTIKKIKLGGVIKLI